MTFASPLGVSLLSASLVFGATGAEAQGLQRLPSTGVPDRIAPPPPARSAVLVALHQAIAPGSAIDHLFSAVAAALDDNDPSTRKQACDALSGRATYSLVYETSRATWDADRAVLSKLSPALERIIVTDPEGTVRAAAVRARAALDDDGRTRPPALPSADTRYVDFLVERYGVEPSPGVRAAIVSVVGGTANGSARRSPAIIRALSDTAADVRMAAAREAGNVKDVLALPRLATLLYDPEMRVRLTAATTIGIFGPLANGYLPQLRQALAREPDPTTQRVIEGAMKSVSR